MEKENPFASYGKSPENENLILPSRKIIRAGIEAAVGAGAPLTPEFTSFIPSDTGNIQVVTLEPIGAVRDIVVQEFALIGDAQVAMLRAAHEHNTTVDSAKDQIRLAFVAVGTDLVFNASSFNPLNYNNIAGDLLNEPAFTAQAMVLSGSFLSNLKRGINSIAGLQQFAKRFGVAAGTIQINERFTAVESVDEANKWLGERLLVEVR